jgi:general secretion pathway protein G
MPAVRAGRRIFGFTIVELLIVVAIVGVLAGVAWPAYSDRREKVRVRKAIDDMVILSFLINNYRLEEGVYPPDLGAIGNANTRDPWGRPYRYLDLQDPKTKGQARKNKNLVPINSDYDLYSMGRDGESRPPLTAKPSRDDVIRANDGRFHGLGSDYE